MNTEQYRHRRQVVCWHLLHSVLVPQGQGPSLDAVFSEILRELDLPEIIGDSRISMTNLLQRYPELKPVYDSVIQTDQFPKDGRATEDFESELRRLVLYAKMLGAVFGQNTQTPSVSAQQYHQWLEDVARLEEMFGVAPGGLRRGGAQAGAGQQGVDGQPGADSQQEADGQSEGGGGGRQGGTGLGRLPHGGSELPDLTPIDNDLLHRMELREVLKDNELAERLTPSMGLVEQLLYDKANLSGVALDNAKSLIRRYVSQLTEVLKLMVRETPSGRIDYSVPPKRVYRNLDLKRTIWKNLPHWDPEDRKLYIDHLFYRHSSRKKNPKRLIVAVDQSGSMVDAMVQCTIIASIFAGVPNCTVDLLAFDTRVMDLTAWVQDPFETLLRTQLGGGTSIYGALQEASKRVTSPKSTGIILVSDFYEGGSYDRLFEYIKTLIESGVHFIPVGAVKSSGYFNVEPWFKFHLEKIGRPILTGSPKKLIHEIKQVLVN